MKPALTCRNLSIGYRHGKQSRILLSDVSLELGPSKVIALLGRNGIGKSTFMRTLAGLQPPLAGSIDLLGKPLQDYLPRDLAKQLAWVAPMREILPGLTAWDLVALGRQPHTAWHGRLSEPDFLAIESAFAECNASEFASRPLTELSDGERQRVALARVLAQETPILFMDEPTAFLDRPGRLMTFRLARKWVETKRQTVLISTHDLELALEYCHEAILLTSGKAMHGECRAADFKNAVDKAFSDAQ